MATSRRSRSAAGATPAGPVVPADPSADDRTGEERIGKPPENLPPEIGTFDEWLAATEPRWNWTWPHLAHVRRQLDRVTKGEIDRLMLFLPPRHCKTEMTTVRYPVWRLSRDPYLRVIVGTYNQTLANKFSRKALRIARERLLLSADRRAAEEWETRFGGGLRAVGVGGGITGQGGHLIVIDDPVKNREEANSAAYRDRVWDWYRDDLYTRLEPGGAMILIQTRWHEDDLAGQLLAEMEGGGERWEVCLLPALAEEGDPLGRAPGEALCPDRYDVPALERIRTVLGPGSFAALYQQRPRPAEGSFFQRDWFPAVSRAPDDAAGPAGDRPACERVRYWDKAGTEGGDYTAGVLLALDRNGIIYVEDVVRGRWTPAKRDEVMLRTAGRDAERHGMAGRGVKIWVEQEPGSGGLDSAQATIRLLAAYPVRADRPSGDKSLRAEPFAAQAEAGNVRLVRGEWNVAYLEELCQFPSGRHDDQVDATSGAYRHLVGGARRLEVS